MPEIKTILSDLGGVAVHFDNTITAAKLAAFSKKYDAKQVEYLLFHPKHSLCHQYASGGLTTEEFCLRTRELLDLSADLTDRDFDAAFADVFTPNREVLDLWARLKHGGLRLVAVSNIEELRAHQLERMGVLEIFDHLVFSFKEGFTKPCQELIVRGLELTDTVPEEAFFTDDLAENLGPAEDLGVHTHPFVNPAGLRKCLSDKGLGRLIYVH